jgi:hypothetical protein
MKLCSCCSGSVDNMFSNSLISLQLDADLVCTVRSGIFANRSVLIHKRSALIPKTLFNYSSHFLNFRCFSYLYRHSFCVIFSRSFVSRTPQFRPFQVTHSHLNTATRNASQNAKTFVTACWQHYRSGSRTF